MIHWLGHSSIRIDGEKAVVYIDPWEVSGPKADIILITHNHYDHCSPDDIAKLKKEGTVVIASPDCVSKLGKDTVALKVGDKWEVLGVKIEAVPAYNIGKKFHPKENEWNGYIITIDGKRIYHSGDTDRIPEMKNITADTAILAIGGTYTMSAEEAAYACKDMNVQEAIPIHFNKVVGTMSDAETFKKESPVPVRILEVER